MAEVRNAEMRKCYNSVLRNAECGISLTFSVKKVSSRADKKCGIVFRCAEQDTEFGTVHGTFKRLNAELNFKKAECGISSFFRNPPVASFPLLCSLENLRLR